MVAYFEPINFDYQSHIWKYGKPIAINVYVKIAFSPDGKFLVSSDNKGCGKLWDVATGEEICMFSDENAPIQISDRTWHLSRMEKFWLGHGQVGLWHLASDRSSSLKAQKIQTLSGNASKVVSVAFSPDGRTLAQAGFRRDRILALNLNYKQTQMLPCDWLPYNGGEALE